MPRNWGMSSRPLILTRASSSRPSGQGDNDGYELLAGGEVVGKIFRPNNAPEATPWFWSVGDGHRREFETTNGYAETREAAMAAFAKSWRRE